MSRYRFHGHHQRLPVHDVEPKTYQPVLGMKHYDRGRGLPEPLYAPVKIRAAQLSGGAYCLDTRNRDARAGGEDQRRLDVLFAWREAPGQFRKQERVTLALTESVTLIGEGGDPDEV